MFHSLNLYSFYVGCFINKQPLFHYAACTVNLLLKHSVIEAGFASIFTYWNKFIRCTP